MACIYKITNLINNKVYIGQTIKTSAQRFANHIYDLNHNIHHSEHLQRSYNKYGKDSLLFEVIETIIDLAIIDDREIYWISFYNSVNPEFGYNRQYGGQVNKVCSLETRAKISKSLIGNQNTKGKKLTLEHKDKIRQSTIKRNTGRKHSEITKRKIGDAFRGEKSVFYGKPGVNRRKVICLNTGEIYESATKAALALKCDRSTICAICRKEIIQTKGLKFEYL